MPTKCAGEVILEVGAELATLTIFRFRQEEKTRFQVTVWDGAPELLDEPSLIVQSEPIDSWDEAVEALDKYNWHRFLPIQIHEDFRELVWKAFCSRVGNVGKHLYIEDWSTKCGAMSDCLRSFGYADFDDRAKLAMKTLSRCPVRGCDATPISVPYRKTELKCCRTHGLRMHARTFAYWNGLGRENKARLRNIIVRPREAKTIALGKGMKAESHRLGNEMSEDALSWNVFVSLMDTGKLWDAAKYLTGRELGKEPDLYLWGRKIPEGNLYGPLERVRRALEPDIRTFITEPDIMLVADGEMLVCIEAKFRSGNPLAREVEAKKGQKPISRKGLLERYLGDKTSARTKRIVQVKQIGQAPCSQLLRNVVFAAEMAQNTPWHVVNLVADSLKGKSDKYQSFSDPTDEITGYLHPDYKHCFTFQTWEGLYSNCIADDPKLTKLDKYFRGKSAHYKRAFVLD
jgi:hypothetical protein